MDEPDAKRLDQIETVFRRVVKPARWPETQAVNITANHLDGEPVRFAEAISGAFTPCTEGDPWGPDWGTTWFHVTGDVPEGWAGQACILTVHLGFGLATGFGAEGQVWIDGNPAQGISPNHHEVPISERATGGEAVDLYIEAAANPPAIPGDPGQLLMPDPGGKPRLSLRRCHLAVVDRQVEDLVRRWSLVRDIASWMGGERAQAARHALDSACSAIESGGITESSVATAAETLNSVLDQGAASERPVHLAVGNSHIDTAWLWPIRETRRKVVRTFSTAASFLEREPNYRFCASQPQQLAWIRDDHPHLWERIRSHVSDGRFEVIGAMWVEPDCNVPSGESLVRQLVHGKRFWRDEFGVEADGLWLPDVFGYSAAMPQILAQAGVDWFLTQKLSWNDTNRFPYQTFLWEGIDGTRIFTHFPPADTYNGDLSIPNLLHSENNMEKYDTASRSIYLYGHGDGGGGPDADMIARLELLADVDGVGRVESVGAAEAIAALRSDASESELPIWVGELYFELHRGTYTTQAKVKKGNRECERGLYEAELWSLAAHRYLGSTIPSADLDRAWKTLLTNQFHDIIPGSSIRWVNDDAERDYQSLRTATESICVESLSALARNVAPGPAGRPTLVANSLPFERDELVELDGELVRLSAPACGWEVVDLDRGNEDLGPPVTSGERWMDNGILRVEWDDAGLLRSVLHHPTGREAIAAGGAANQLQLLDDRPKNYDAWDIDREALDTAVDITDLDDLTMISASDDKAVLRVVRSFGSSRIEQLLSLTRGSRRLEISCIADWHEDHKLLKVAFPLNVHTSVARHEIQFGHVERPTHRNTTWDQARFETCAHKWVDLSEDGFGTAILNDSKYGHDVLGTTVRVSLLRSPTWPDPVADRGRHEFALAIYPHAGGPTAGGVIAEAHAFNTPLRAVAMGETTGTLPTRCSMVEPDAPGIVISAVKCADDGDGVIIRFFEAFGGTRTVGLRVPGVSRADRVDLLEEELGSDPLVISDGVVHITLRAFELVTLRLR